MTPTTAASATTTAATTHLMRRAPAGALPPRSAVHGECGEKRPVAVVVASGERVLVAFEHDGVPVSAWPDVLEPQAELIRPEVRRVREWLVGAGDRGCDRARLAGGARPVLDP